MRKGWQVSFRSDHERIQRQQEAQRGGGKPCGRGHWCSMATRERKEDGTWERQPAMTSRAFCDRDAVIIGSCLRSYPDGYALLTRMLGYHQTAEVLVRVPFGPSVALRVDLDELARLLIDGAMSWLERVSLVDSTLTVPDTQAWREQSLGRRAGDLLGYAVPRLAERVSALTALEAGPMMRPELVAALGCGETQSAAADMVMVEASGLDAGNEALRLGYVWKAALGLTPAPKDDLLGVDCESCGKRALRRALPPMHEGDQSYYAACEDCGAMFTDDEMKDHLGRLVRFYSHRITPAMLASAGLRGDESPAVADACSRAAA